VTQLEFDPTKDIKNRAKHGISLSMALSVYDAPFKLTLHRCRNGEQRCLDIALIQEHGVLLALVYVMRGKSVRAISLRVASRAERRFYEEARTAN